MIDFRVNSYEHTLSSAQRWIVVGGGGGVGHVVCCQDGFDQMCTCNNMALPTH